MPVLADDLPRLLAGTDEAAEAFGSAVASFTADGVPEALAERVAALPALYSALDIIDVASANGRGLQEVAGVYFALDQQLKLDWLRERILRLPAPTAGRRWPAPRCATTCMPSAPR